MFDIVAESENFTVSKKNGDEVADYGWLPAFPHVLIASMSNFLFGYHIGSVFLSLLSYYHLVNDILPL